MESQDKINNGVIDRLSGLERRMDRFDDKVEKLEDKVEVMDNKHDQRHLEMAILTTSLKETSKATENNTQRMANSIEGLVEELKTSNQTTNRQFEKVNKDISEIKGKLQENSDAMEVKLEEKRMSNKVLLSILTGMFAICEIFIRVIVPLFVGN